MKRMPPAARKNVLEMIALNREADKLRAEMLAAWEKARIAQKNAQQWHRQKLVRGASKP